MLGGQCSDLAGLVLDRIGLVLDGIGLILGGIGLVLSPLKLINFKQPLTVYSFIHSFIKRDTFPLCPLFLPLFAFVFSINFKELLIEKLVQERGRRR